MSSFDTMIDPWAGHGGSHARSPGSHDPVSLTSPDALAELRGDSDDSSTTPTPSSQKESSPSPANDTLGIMDRAKATYGATTVDDEGVLDDDSLDASTKAAKLQQMLFAVSISGDFAAARQLLGGPAAAYLDLNARDPQTGATALIYASGFGHSDIVLELLRYGALPDIQDKAEYTALMWAMTNQHEMTVRNLLENGARVDIKTSAGRSALDLIGANSSLHQYMEDHGYIESEPKDFYDNGIHNPHDDMLESAAYNLDVNLDHLGLDDHISDDDADDFQWERCRPDQMLVFREDDIPTILDAGITNMQPKRSKGQKPLPANLLFLCSRYAHYYGTPETLANLLTPALQRIRVQVLGKTEDIAYLSFWLSNCTLLLYYLRKDPGLLEATPDYQSALAELIADITVLISQDVERRLDLVLDSSLLDYETMPGLDDIRYQSEWRFFRHHRKTKSHKEEMEEGYRPPSPKSLMRPSPRNVTSILGSVLFVTDLYDIHPVIAQELMSQLFYWLGAVLFNRLLAHRKYLARSRAMQIRLNVSALEDWARANNRRPVEVADEFHDGAGLHYPSLTELCRVHLTPLVEMLQWLQIFTGFGSDMTSVVATLQQLSALTPRQLLHVAKKYRAEVGEPGLSKEYKTYLAQLNVHDQQANSHGAKVLAATIHTVCAGKEDEKEEGEEKEDKRKSIDKEVPKILPGHGDQATLSTEPPEEKENGQQEDTASELAVARANSIKPVRPSARLVPRTHGAVDDNDDDDDGTPGAGDLYMDASAVLPFVVPTLREMIVTWGRGLGGTHAARARNYEPTLPGEFLDKLDLGDDAAAAAAAAAGLEDAGTVPVERAVTKEGLGRANVNPIFGGVAVPEPSAAKEWGDLDNEDVEKDEFRNVWSSSEYTPVFAPFFGFAGCAAAIILSSAGAAVGTAKSGIGISGIGTFKPELIMKSLIPVIMSGILAVYGLVVAVLIAGDLNPTETYSLFNGFMHLACGLCVGFAALAAGYAIGIVGDEGVRQLMLQPRLFVGIVLILIFAEVLGLYGMIIALILNTKGSG